MEQKPHNNEKSPQLPVTPEMVVANFEAKRIHPDAKFGQLYSTFADDMARTDRVKKMYEAQPNQDQFGFLGEALVFSCIENGALGTGITARGTSPYDDLFHGADVAIESKGRQQRDPIVSSIDVTLSQMALDARQMSPFEAEGVVNEIGLEKKLERVKRHIAEVARYPRERAVDMSAWLQSGGLSQPKTKDNFGKFEEAEKLMLLKYYTNPATSEDPNKPHFVLAGPQVVLSIDRSFVNKAFSGNNQQKAINDINALIQAEVPFAVGMITRHAEDLAKDLNRRGQSPNLFFDMLRASCRAWELTFTTEQNQLRLQNAIQTCLKDPELKKQIMYYQSTLSKSFI